MSEMESTTNGQNLKNNISTNELQENLTSDNDAGLSDQQRHLLSRLDMLLPAIADIHNTLDRKLQFNFGLMSSILTILIVGNFSWFDQSRLEVNETGSFIVFTLCFIIVAACLLWAHWPRGRLFTPLTPTWDTLSKWWEYTPNEYSEQTLLSYQTIYEDGLPIRRCKARLTVVSHVAVIVGLLAAFCESAVSLGLF